MVIILPKSSHLGYVLVPQIPNDLDFVLHLFLRRGRLQSQVYINTYKVIAHLLEGIHLLSSLMHDKFHGTDRALSESISDAVVADIPQGRLLRVGLSLTGGRRILTLRLAYARLKDCERLVRG